MLQVTLFRLKNENISIDIQAYFDEESLVIEGYDIGKRVKEYWGDSDYEYSITIAEEEVKKLYALMNIQEGHKEDLLKAIAERYNTNSCFSEFRDFLDKNEVGYKGFSWT
jgi:hypothetical protein